MALFLVVLFYICQVYESSAIDCSVFNTCQSCALMDQCAWCSNFCITIIDECVEEAAINGPGCSSYTPIAQLSFNKNEHLKYNMVTQSCQTNDTINITYCDQEHTLISLWVALADNAQNNYILYSQIDSIWTSGINVMDNITTPPLCEVFIKQSVVKNITCGNWTDSIPANNCNETNPNRLQTDTILSLLHGLLPRLDTELYHSNIENLNYSEYKPNGKVFVHRTAIVPSHLTGAGISIDPNLQPNTELTINYNIDEFEEWDIIAKPNHLSVDEFISIDSNNNHITTSTKHERIELQTLTDNHLHEVDINISLVSQECCVEEQLFVDIVDLIYGNELGYFVHHFNLEQWRKCVYADTNNHENDVSEQEQRRRLNSADYLEIFNAEKTLASLELLGFSIEIVLFADVGVGLPWEPRDNHNSWSPNGCSSFGDYIAKQTNFYTEITDCCNTHDGHYVDCNVDKVVADNALINCIKQYDNFTAGLFKSALSDLPIISTLFYYRAKMKYCYLDASNAMNFVEISSGIEVKINGGNVWDHYFIGSKEIGKISQIADKRITIFGGCIPIAFLRFCIDLDTSILFELDGMFDIVNEELILEVNPKISVGIVVDASVEMVIIKGGLEVRGDIIQATVPYIYVNIPLTGKIQPYINIDLILETAVVTITVYWKHITIKCKCWFCLCPKFVWSKKKTIWSERFVLGPTVTITLLSWGIEPKNGKDLIYTLDVTIGANSTNILVLPSSQEIINHLHLWNEYISCTIALQNVTNYPSLPTPLPKTVYPNQSPPQPKTVVGINIPQPKTVGMGTMVGNEYVYSISVIRDIIDGETEILEYSNDDYEITINLELYQEATQKLMISIFENSFVDDLMNMMLQLNQIEFDLAFRTVEANQYLYESFEPTPAPTNPPEIIIWGAAYGPADVTNIISVKYTGGVRSFPAENSEFGDPWKGVDKSLVIGYELNTELGESLGYGIQFVSEYHTLVISGNVETRECIYVGELKVKEVVIIGAVYGLREVTETVETMVKVHYLNSDKENFIIYAYNSVFGDSWPGVVKTLVIIYKVNDIIKTVICKEGGFVIIDWS